MLKAQMLYTLALNNMALVTMRGNVPITMSLGLHIRILELDDTRDPFAVATVKYYYKLATPNDEEILAFHWSPAAVGETAVRFPHLHVGPAVVSRSSEVRPRTFHKVHVPTGHVSIQSVIPLAITEFSVTSLRPNWQAILDDADSNEAHETERKRAILLGMPSYVLFHEPATTTAAAGPDSRATSRRRR
jgi:hypothetical protein